MLFFTVLPALGEYSIREETVPFHYSCVTFDQNGVKKTFQGELGKADFDLFFNDGCIANYDKVEIPKDAVVFGVLTVTNAESIKTFPLHKWQDGNDIWCGFPLNTSESGSLGFKSRCNSELFINLLEKRLNRKYRTVREIAWDPNSFKTKSINIAKSAISDILLVLILDKTHYTATEPIHAQLRLVNLKSRCIVVDGIVPYRNSANPPTIIIKNSVNEMAKPNGIPQELLNEKAFVIHSGKSVIMFEADITKADGIVASEYSKDGYHKTAQVKSLRNWLQPGTYTISAFFHTTIYGGQTGDMQIEIASK